eukprot:SAG22_NODE_107_length_19899_cov_24.034141_8_plen_171_part_01
MGERDHGAVQLGGCQAVEAGALKLRVCPGSCRLKALVAAWKGLPAKCPVQQHYAEMAAHHSVRAAAEMKEWERLPEMHQTWVYKKPPTALYYSFIIYYFFYSISISISISISVSYVSIISISCISPSSSSIYSFSIYSTSISISCISISSSSIYSISISSYYYSISLSRAL